MLIQDKRECVYNWSSKFKIEPKEIIEDYKEHNRNPKEIKFYYSQGGMKDNEGIWTRGADVNLQIIYSREINKERIITEQQQIEFIKNNVKELNVKIKLIYNIPKNCMEILPIDFAFSKEYITIREIDLNNIWVEDFIIPFRIFYKEILKNRRNNM